MLKSFDFFRKIQTDQELTSATGGIFTLISMIAAGLLILMSLQDFYEDKYYTFLAVKNDDSDYLPMQINIIFPHLPCELLSIEFHDELEYKEMDLQSKLTLQNVAQGAEQGEIYKRELKDLERVKLIKHLNEKFGCRARGILPLPKTPGTLTFNSKASSHLHNSLSPDQANKVRMNYLIRTLQFGTGNNTFDFPIAHKSKSIERYIKQLEGDVNTRQFVHDTRNENRYLNFYNHVKIIPLSIDDKSINTTDVDKYRYSLRSGNIQTNVFDQKVDFMTEIEPIHIVYKKQVSKIYDLTIEILAIVGGTVATLGIVNSLSHFLFGIK